MRLDDLIQRAVAAEQQRQSAYHRRVLEVLEQRTREFCGEYFDAFNFQFAYDTIVYHAPIALFTYANREYVLLQQNNVWCVARWLGMGSKNDITHYTLSAFDDLLLQLHAWRAS